MPSAAPTLSPVRSLTRDVCPSAVLCAALGAILCAASGAASGAYAVPDGARVTFSGFGTLGYAVLDDADAEYRVGRAVDGADSSGSFELDTRLGLQLDAEFGPTLSATVQGVAREGPEGEAEANVEWAFLRWSASDSVTVRVGRLALPLFALSDYREVGYANVMLRPVEDVYGHVPIRSFDGGDLSVHGELGETLWSLQLGAGQTDVTFYDGVEFEARDMIGLNVVAERGPLRLRLSHTRTRSVVASDSVDALGQGLAQAARLVPSLTDLAGEFSRERVPSSFSAIGLSLDLERVFLDAEYTRRTLDAWPPDIDGWYLSAGARLGTLTPYAFVSASRGTEDRRRGVALPDIPALAPLEAGVNNAFLSRDQSTVGLGLRWDFAPNLALKGQVERVSGERGRISHSLARRFGDAPGDGGDVVLSSVAIDFVF